LALSAYHFVAPLDESDTTQERPTKFGRQQCRDGMSTRTQIFEWWLTWRLLKLLNGKDRKMCTFSAWPVDNPFSYTPLVEPLSTILSVGSCFRQIVVVKVSISIFVFNE
jgi:hypothetical protein